MLTMLSQVPLPETPKNGDMAAWFGWVMAVLGILTLGALGYLIATAKSKDDAANKATDKMVEVFQKMIEKLDDRHEEEKQEHEYDRKAFVDSQAHVKEALVQVNQTQLAMTHEIRSLGEKVDRNGGVRERSV